MQLRRIGPAHARDLISLITREQTFSQRCHHHQTDTYKKHPKLTNLLPNLKYLMFFCSVLATKTSVLNSAWNQFVNHFRRHGTFGDAHVCREYTLLRDHPDACPKGSIGVNTILGPAVDVVVT